MSEENPTSDEQLLKVQQLFLAQAPALRAWFLGVVPDPDLADDLVQDTFLVVMKKSSDFQAGTNFRAWIFTIARYKLLEACRHHWARAITLEPEAMEMLIGDQSELPANPDQRLQSLQSCLKKLPERAREIVEMRYFRNLRPPDIASRLSWTSNSVSVSLSRSRLALRKCIQNAMGLS
jgi:RNA polymerase sigma-70 factor (ECF subfamily)